MDEAKCLSDRSLRYGRNIMVICFVACGVKFFAGDFSGASLFGITVQKQQFWAVLFFLLIWHLVYFVILVDDDIQNWWYANVSIQYPSPKYVIYLRTPPKSIEVDHRTFTLVKDHPEFRWETRAGNSTKSAGVELSVHKQIRRTIKRVLLLDGGFPILFSLFTIFLVVREWLTLAFWKSLFG